MIHIHLDPLGGLAGDMFLAALLDARPACAPIAFEAMRASGLPEAWRVGLQRHDDGRLTGHRLMIEPHGSGSSRPTGVFREIRERLVAAPLSVAVRDHTVGIFTHLAEAEAAVHGTSVEEVHFHELADWDSVADIVGAAALIDALGASSWSIGTLPQGGGRVATQHGPLPVPAPATALLLAGFNMIDDGIAGERVTPTGAAILRHLGAAERLPPGPWRLETTGIGFGTKQLPGISNVLRALVYEQAERARIDEQVAVITCEIDDQSGEELAVGLDHLRTYDGVLDVIQLPAFGKKGRLVTHLQLLARPERLDAVIAACFAETTTIGLRWRLEARTVLARDEVTVAGPEAEVGVKIVTRPGGERTAKAEIDQVRAVAGGHAARSEWRRAAEARARDEELDERNQGR